MKGFEHNPHAQPEAHRRTMTAQEADVLLAAIGSGEPLTDELAMSAFVADLSKPERLDPESTLAQFAESLNGSYALVWRDLALARACLGNEHAEAVLAGLEIDYAELFYSQPQALQVLRLTALLQDIGKAVCVAKTGSNRQQSSFNGMVSRAILNEVPNQALSAAEDSTEQYAQATAIRQAVLALVGQDIIGGLLQQKDTSADLAQLRKQWPAELAGLQDDLLLVSYLTDASAHTPHRLMRNWRYQHHAPVEPAVRPEDMQLSFLFERHHGGALTLTPERCELLLQHLPALNKTRYLLTGETSPVAREDAVFTEVIKWQLQNYTTEESCTLSGPPPEEADSPNPSIAKLTLQHTADDTSFSISKPLSDRVVHYQHYFLPGDGRLWRRAHTVYPDPFGLMDAIPFVSETASTHADPEVRASLKNGAYTRAVEGQDVGRPLSPTEAWKLIRYITEEL